jgi:hypothetical protein
MGKKGGVEEEKWEKEREETGSECRPNNNNCHQQPPNNNNRKGVNNDQPRKWSIP